ncbi:MAG: DMT family transporter [Pseudomonadota bacterium]
MRVGLAAVTLWTVALILKWPIPKAPGIWFAFLCMGLINNVIPFSLIVWGQKEIASGLASILNAATPMFTILVAGLMLPDERITRLKVVGIVIGFAAVIIMIGPSALGGLGDQLWAQLAVVGATISYAFAGAYGRRFREMGVDPNVTAAGQVTASTVVLVPITLMIEDPLSLPFPSLATVGSIIGVAVLSTAMAYVLYFKILARAGALNLLLVTLLIPVSAIGLGWLVLGEQLETVHFVGLALLAVGLSAIDGRLWQRKPFSAT